MNSRVWLRFGSILVLCVGAIPEAKAQVNWTGTTSGAWATTTNWTGGVPAGSTTSTNTDIALFGVATQPSVGLNFANLGADYYLGTIRMTTSATARTFGSSGGTAGTLTLNGTGANFLILDNQVATTMNLNALNGGTGNMTLRLGNLSSTIAATTNATISIGANITELNAGSGFTFNGSAGVSGTSAGGILNLSGANAFTGDITLNGGGRLQTSTATGLGTGTKTVTVNSGTSFYLTAAVTIGSNVSFNIAGNGFNEISGNLGALRVESGTIAGTVTLTANSRITNFVAGNTATLGGVVSGAFALEKTGAGIINLTADNSTSTVTGTTVNAGSLRYNALNNLPGTTTASTSVNTTSNTTGGITSTTLSYTQLFNDTRINPASTGVYALSGNASLAIDYTSLTQTFPNLGLGAAVNSTYTGTFTPVGTTYRLGGGGGTLTFGSALSDAAGPTTRNVVINPGSAVVLSVANSYTGTTTVSTSSTLSLTNGNALGTGAVTNSATINVTGPAGTNYTWANTFTNNGTIVVTSSSTGTANTLTYTGTMTGSGSISIQGGSITVPNVLTLGSGANVTTNSISVSNTTGAPSRGTLNIQAGATLTIGTGSFLVGNAVASNPGIVNHSGGTFNYNSTFSDGNGTYFRIGHWPNSSTSDVSQYNLSGGSLNVPNVDVYLAHDGNANMTVDGTGTANVRGIRVNRSTGKTGILTLGAGGTINVGTSGIYTGGGTATFNLSGGTLTTSAAAATFLVSMPAVLTAATTTNLLIPSGSNSNVTGILSGTGSFVKTGLGSLSLNAANTFNPAGGVSVSAGSLRTNNATGFGNIASQLLLGDTNTGSDPISVFATVQNITIAKPITVTANGTGTVTIGTIGSLTAAANTEFSGILTLARDVVLTNSTNDRTTFSGKITGTGNVAIVGGTTGNARVSWNQLAANANDFTGDITITNQFQLGVATANANQFIPDASNVTINTGGTLRLSSTNGGSEAINGLNGAGNVTNTEGTGYTFTVGAGNANGNFTGAITTVQTGFTLVKAGAGTQILGGTNTFTGATTVNAGVLVVNGSTTATNAITVNNGGTLGGTGTIAGSITVVSGGTVRGDSGTGTSPLNTANVGIAGGGILLANLGGNGINSALALGGNTLNLNSDNSNSVLKLNSITGFDRSITGQQWVLASGGTIHVNGSEPADLVPFATYTEGTGSTGSITFDVSTLGLQAGDELTLARSGSTLVLNYTPVPEPGTVGFLAAAGLGIGWLRRRPKR